MKKYLLLLLLIPLVVWAADPVEPLSGARVVIDQAHAEIHAGDSFLAFYEQTVSDTNDQTIIAFKTPPSTGKLLHMVATAYADDESVFVILEGPTVSLTGQTSDYIPLNRNRGSSNTATAYSFTDPITVGEVSIYDEEDAAAVSSGTTIFSESIGSSGFTPISGTPGESRGLREFVLAPDTEYAFVMTASTDNDTLHRIQIDWYEHSVSNSTEWYEE